MKYIKFSYGTNYRWQDGQDSRVYEDNISNDTIEQDAKEMAKFNHDNFEQFKHDNFESDNNFWYEWEEITEEQYYNEEITEEQYYNQD